MLTGYNLKARLYRKAIVSIEAGSVKLATWSLSVFGGSVLIIFADSYLRASDAHHRLTYLLFLIGWAFIAWSMHQGFKIAKHTKVLELHYSDENVLITILQKCNASFASQLKWFQRGLLVFAVWLIFYLIWWIGSDIPKPK